MKLSVVMLELLYENQAERNIERILMEAITQTTYTLRIFISKRKNILFPHLRNERKSNNFGLR